MKIINNFGYVKKHKSKANKLPPTYKKK